MSTQHSGLSNLGKLNFIFYNRNGFSKNIINFYNILTEVLYSLLQVAG